MIKALEHSHGMSSMTDSDKKLRSHFSSLVLAVFLMAMKAFMGMSLAVMITDLLFFTIDLDFFNLLWLGALVRASDWRIKFLRKKKMITV